jgi:hypothetical protein
LAFAAVGPTGRTLPTEKHSSVPTTELSSDTESVLNPPTRFEFALRYHLRLSNKSTASASRREQINDYGKNLTGGTPFTKFACVVILLYF